MWIFDYGNVRRSLMLYQILSLSCECHQQKNHTGVAVANVVIVHYIFQTCYWINVWYFDLDICARFCCDCCETVTPQETHASASMHFCTFSLESFVQHAIANADIVIEKYLCVYMSLAHIRTMHSHIQCTLVATSNPVRLCSLLITYTYRWCSTVLAHMHAPKNVV